ncbi:MULTISPECIES: BCD family MFS transporter [unclassified Sphingomonas]|uniref:BCD family MFS transporter n=1 Tax=unclassified Sphingomonas TaxID=196159 RepID=UPI000BCE3457|nr:MAG: MFS transporter [Sphingomonas sp. 12-62-6]OYX40275.1 MAG: MFS transporter [Sphingomonas sp. 32-62-10]
MSTKTLGWLGIVRIGLVQSAIGAMVMLVTSLLNRVMVVEYALPAALPAGLVAWHYAVQLSRPAWGHGSDQGNRRTPWIVFGMALLALGALVSVNAVPLLAERVALGYFVAVIGYSMIGAGVGAAGTSLLALLAGQVAPERRAAAASITWIMMVLGIVITAGVAGSLIDPYSLQRLAMVASGVALVAFVVALLALWGLEHPRQRLMVAAQDAPSVGFGAALREMLAETDARQFTIFVFLSMLAYSMQDMILEPFAGLLFDYTPGQSTQLSGMQHGGVLVGMIVVGFLGSAFGGGTPASLRRWIVGGCVGSAVALAGLAVAAQVGAAWPLTINIVLLGFANGVFAVAAIGAMMGLAGAQGPSRSGIRMGVWGASQAIAFGLGGLIGAVGVDIGRALAGADAPAFLIVFAGEAALFLVAAWLAMSVSRSRDPARRSASPNAPARVNLPQEVAA